MFPCNDDGRFFKIYCVYVGFAQDGDRSQIGPQIWTSSHLNQLGGSSS